MQYLIGTLLMYCVLGFSSNPIVGTTKQNVFSYLQKPSPVTRELANFRGIDIRHFKDAGLDILLKQGKEEKVEISSEKYDVEDVMTIVENNVLKIYSKKNKVKPIINNNKGEHDIKIAIYYKEINKITSNAAADFTVDKELTANNFKFDISGASTIKGKFVIKEDLYLDVSGAVTIDLKGASKSLQLQLSGAGSINTFELKAEEVRVELSGACNAKVHAENSLNADISGVGTVVYAGNPKKVIQNVSGFGSISQKD